MTTYTSSPLTGLSAHKIGGGTVYHWVAQSVTMIGRLQNNTFECGACLIAQTCQFGFHALFTPFALGFSFDLVLGWT